MSTRFEADAAEVMRQAIVEAGGVEVFAIGDVEAGHVIAVTITCRGTEDRVPALLDRPRAGQVVIHNHPSGDLHPSEPDLQLAHLYGENGVGVVIVDNAVGRAHWVVEPHHRPPVPVDDRALTAFFTEGLPKALPGWEARPQQLEMARAVARSLADARPLLCEAGTGTGKSLAYLVPAALWALANDTKVVVSTFTKALQAQLVASDLPMLAKGGIAARTAVLQGRNNYLCRRRLALALAEPPGPERATWEALAAWSDTTSDGSRSDLPMAVELGTWDQVLSDGQLTLSIRCPHYDACHYYRARRQASGAHVIVVNHALLLSDLALRADAGRGFLPKYDRVILDEAHHLEDAATGVASSRLTSLAVTRAIGALRGSRSRRGALDRLVQVHGDAAPAKGSPLSTSARAALGQAVAEAETRLLEADIGSSAALSQLAEELVPRDPARRVTRALTASPGWRDTITPLLRSLGAGLTSAATALDKVAAVFEEVVLSEADAQPLLDVRRARGRLAEHAGVASAFLGDGDDDGCRWIEAITIRGGPREAGLNLAPIEVGAVVNRILWTPLPGTVCTSATLTVGGRFDAFARRVGLPADPPPEHRPTELTFPSPFDHARQAVLGLPRDLVPPDHASFLADSARVVVEAVETSDGGAFVLCTSHAAVKAYTQALRDAGTRPVIAQGDAGRAVVLDRFRADRRAVLVGTDTFWEGVSVRGDGLRLVIIPRMPFRVPTEPLQEARHERIAARGGDAFKALSLPDAVLKLRQGYGRLIRSHTDRGAVLLLDRRIHDKPYGAVVLRSLPPAKRVTGPWRVVRDALAELFGVFGPR